MTNDITQNAALTVLHATVSDLQATLANNLAQAGIDATINDHVDTLVAKAQAVANASATRAPNFADAALAAFHAGMHAALAAFATLHLPAKFQPAGTLAMKAVDELTSGNKADETAAVKNAIAAGVAVSAAINPLAGVAASIAAPTIENIVDEVIANHIAEREEKSAINSPTPVATWER